MLILGVRIQQPLRAPSRHCLRIKCNFSNSSCPHQALHCVDEECGDFLNWLRQKARVEISSVLSIGKSNYGRSLFACKPIQAGDCILKVPYSAQLAPDNLHPSVHSLLGEDVSDVARLALVILLHQRLGQASEWAPYISCLPHVADMHSTIFWSDEEMNMIKISSLYHDTLIHKAKIEKDFSSIKHVLDRFPEYFEGVTLHEFKHAYNLVESRAWISTRGVSMIPFADFFNHDAYSETDVLSDDFKQVSEVIADENYAPGDEVLIRYGKFSNARLLLDFGFIIPHNKYDQVKVEVNAPQHDQLHALKLDILRRHATPSLKDINDLSSQENGFMVMEVKSSSGKGRGIPQSLRALARVLCCTSPQELHDLAMEATQNDGRLARNPLKNRAREVEAHQLLHSRFVHMIENYNAALESLTLHSSEINTRRMQLARDFLAGELRILESASAPICRAPICWEEVGERIIEGPELVQITHEKVATAREKLKEAQSRQKSYADRHRRPLEFKVGDKVFLKVSPCKSVRRFGLKGKLSPRFIGPFEILERVGEVSYRLALPPQLSHVHDVFHVSLLRGYNYHPLHIVNYPLHLIREDLSFEEEPEAILDRQGRTMRKKTIPFVKVLWKNHSEREATWEMEDTIRPQYPHLFTS